MTKRKSKKPACPRKPVNAEVREVDRSDPATWGGADPVRRWADPPREQVVGAYCPCRLVTKARGPQEGYFAYLIDNGALTQSQVQAGQEIAEVYLAVVGGLLSHSQNYERIDRGYDSDWPVRIAEAWGLRYKPWADEMGRWSIKKGKPALPVVIGAVVDACSRNEIAAREHILKERVKPILITALQEYVRMAGWERPPAKIRVSA